ncbi:hypothetical protein ACET3Z_031815 [Daucus carota]
MSDSKSSSSSVRNPFGTINNSFTTHKYFNSELESCYNGIKCRCDLLAPCQEAWREGTLDPGRRFFGCSQYKDASKKCNFFVWADPPYTERAREVVQHLKTKLRVKEDQLEKTMAELRFIEKKMVVLNEECMSLRKKNDELTASIHIKRDGSKMKKLVLLMIITWVVFRFFK